MTSSSTNLPLLQEKVRMNNVLSSLGWKILEEELDKYSSRFLSGT